MLDGLYSAAAGLFAQQSRMDMLSNDIDNVSKTGYKQERVGFRDLIYAQGVVKAKGTTIGKITVVDVPGESGLLSIGNNLYMPTAASGAPQPAGKDTTVQQGYLEASNVDLGSAMVDVMDAQRSYSLD